MEVKRRAIAGGGLLGLATVALGVSPARAQDFPSQPIRLINPFATGGTADIIARLLGQEMGNRLGRPIVVESRPGAGGSVGAAFVAAAPPDGYTLLTANVASNAIVKGLYSRLGYDPLDGFTHVGGIGSFPNILLVPKNSPITSLADLLARAKGRPGEIAFGSAGNGSTPHLTAAMLQLIGDISLLHIPYRGAGPAAQALLANDTVFQFENMPTAMGYLANGEFRALGITSAERSALLPNVPTMVEQGMAGFVAESWYGLSGPANMPQAVTQRLAVALRESLADQALIERLSALGIRVQPRDGAAFRAYVAEEIVKWARIIRASGASVD